MKTKLFFLGSFFFLLITTPLYAQKLKKLEKKEMKQKEMKQIDIVKPPKLEKVPERVFPVIDPLTKEIIPRYNPSPGNEITILTPASHILYPNTTYSFIELVMILQWKATPGHTVEIKTLRETIHGFYGVVQDWTPFVVDEPDGIMDKPIPFSGSPRGHSLLIKILIRDTADRSQVKTIFIGHE